jgi:hypothetical protein
MAIPRNVLAYFGEAVQPDVPTLFQMLRPKDLAPTGGAEGKREDQFLANVRLLLRHRRAIGLYWKRKSKGLLERQLSRHPRSELQQLNRGSQVGTQPHGLDPPPFPNHHTRP